MKTLNFIDLGAQTLILGVVLISSMFISFTGHFEGVGIVAMYGAVFLGPWQLVSSLITVISRGLFFKWRVIHLVSAIVYLGLVSIVAAFFTRQAWNGFLEAIAVFVGFGVPVALALFYYYITFKSFQLSRAEVKAVV